VTNSVNLFELIGVAIIS